jgi:hypothetical protein
MASVSEATIGKGRAPPGTLGIEGAQKVVAEFPSSEKIINYFLFLNGGKRNNLLRSGILLLSVSIGAIGLFLFPQFSPILLGADAFLTLVLLALLYRKMFKHAADNFEKEKCFLTESHLVVQHSMVERTVRFIEFVKIKKIERKAVPFFGNSATVVYMDAENIAEQRERVYFPDNLTELEAKLLDAAARAKDEKERKDKAKEAKEIAEANARALEEKNKAAEKA